MIRLMKLELEKINLSRYILLSIAGIVISMFFVFVGLNDNSTDIYDYDVSFTMIGLIFCFYYIILFSIMVVAYIINEYTQKTIFVMFTYPVDRRKLIMSKLLMITLLTAISMAVGYICCGVFLILVDRYLNLLTGEFEISVLSHWIPAAVKAILTFCIFGIGTFVSGMIKKSIPMTIVSAIIFCYIRQFFLAGMDVTEESWLFIAVIGVIAIVGVFYTLRYKVTQVE